MADNVNVNTAVASMLGAPKVGCYLHQLNLAARHIVDADVVTKLNHQLYHVACTTRRQQFASDCAAARLGSIKVPDRYGKTRFLTMQPVLQWAVYVKEVISECLTAEQWEHVEAVSVVVKDLHRCMLQSQALTTTTICHHVSHIVIRPEDCGRAGEAVRSMSIFGDFDRRFSSMPV